ncbi:MAG TPA: 16S rRNA (cytosine(1402)-N(4))-methyltransferase RsmH [Beutenbergiaceae bacterium]|nr:16S rRNA (cytosine(1402)-N(4))-methyltransferase RsmH [Beutenbergiaceae bacterium]
MDHSSEIGALHAPVLADRCLELLTPPLSEPGAVLVDATLGMGGHTELLLDHLPDLQVIGIDRDPQALDLARRRLSRFGERFLPVHAVYDEIATVIAEEVQTGAVQGVLFDLGVSSLQLDRPERGFSYAKDAPLDMRMDTSRGRTAAELLATEPEGSIRWILHRFGEEKFAGRIAAAVVAARREHPLTRSSQLVELVREAIPHAARRTGGNPAKRTFQALRIAVNAELEVLTRALPAAVEALAVAGRIVVLSYHSGEDRQVKQVLRRGATSSTPQGLPTELADHEPYLRLLTRGAERAGESEREANPRSAPVRLRAAERLRPTPRHLEVA